MTNPDATRFLSILQTLRQNRFRDVAGARFTLDLPLSEPLLNELIAASLRSSGPVRSITIRPAAGDRFDVRIVPKAAFIPAITLQLQVAEQPRLPESPVLTLKMVTLGGLFGLASGVIAGFLPPGVRLDGERILVNLRELAVQQGQAEAFGYLTAIQVHTEVGRVVAHVSAAVG